MVQNPSKSININPFEPKLVSKSHNFCMFTLSKNQQNITIMTKFILNTFQRKNITNGLHNDNDEKEHHFKFMKYLTMPIPRRISYTISNLLRNNNNNNNNKSSDEQQCEDSKGHNSNESRSSKIEGSLISCSKFPSVASDKKLHRLIMAKTVRKKGMKIRRIIRIKKKGMKRERGFELCKMKILMGEKCRPLYGTLRYDKNGVLIPQDLNG